MKYFSLIYQGEIHPAADKKIIPGKEISTLMDAHEIVKRAREDSELLFENNKKECERLKEESRKEGFQKGLETFNEHLIHFEQELKRLRLELQQQILPLALKAAKKIVAKELELYPETIVDIVIQAITPATQNRRFTLYVSKEDKDVLEQNKSRIKDILEHLESLTIAERSDLEPGSVIIETEAGIINASMENQWRALESAFSKYTKR